MRYDRNVLEQYAQELEDRADRLPRVRATLGAIIGLVAGFAVASQQGTEPGVWGIATTAVGGLIGYAFAQGEAFRLRVQAHTILLQMQIEQNTRKDAAK